jgi:hypothetical protein
LTKSEPFTNTPAVSLTVLLLCSAAFLIAVSGLLAGLVFLSRLHLPKTQRVGAVTLILPLTGEASDLRVLLGAIEAQTLQPRRLLICLESIHDPAYVRATQLAKSTQLPVEIVTAAEATQCAQKCSNQIAGLRSVDARDEVVVLFDADILPQPWWLSALASPILNGSADIVTGYRWPIVTAQRLGAHLIAAIDRGIALLPRFGTFQVTWGGSLALSPQALDKIGVTDILAATLSDDCAIGSRAGALGLRVLTRRALLVPTPSKYSLAAAWRFGRRQYQIIRVYRPQLWWLAFLTLSARLSAWVALLINMEKWWAPLAIGVLMGFALVAVVIQALVGQRLGMTDPLGVSLRQAALGVCKPLIELFHWSLVLAAGDTRTIRWGHLTYRVFGPEQIAVMRRKRWD